MRRRWRVELGEVLPWKRWHAHAIDAGVEKEIASYGRRVNKKAYLDGWTDDKCVFGGWKFDVQADTWVIDDAFPLIGLALKHPREVLAVWKYLLMTDGEFKHLVDGKWVMAVQFRRPLVPWNVVTTALVEQVADLKKSRAQRMSVPEAGDVVRFSTAENDHRPGRIVGASADNSTLIIEFKEKTLDGRRSNLEVIRRGREYFTQEDRQVHIEVLEGSRPSLPAKQPTHTPPDDDV